MKNEQTAIIQAIVTAIEPIKSILTVSNKSRIAASPSKSVALKLGYLKRFKWFLGAMLEIAICLL